MNCRQENYARIRKVETKSYLNNRKAYLLRSKMQHLRGKIAYEMLSDKDKAKCDRKVKKIIDQWNISVVVFKTWGR